jgi:hypothetical protein
MEKEYIIAVVGKKRLPELKRLARKQGFQALFEKPGPSRARGVKEDTARAYVHFVRTPGHRRKA